MVVVVWLMNYFDICFEFGYENDMKLFEDWLSKGFVSIGVLLLVSVFGCWWLFYEFFMLDIGLGEKVFIMG